MDKDTEREAIEDDIRLMTLSYMHRCSGAQLKALQTYLTKKHHELVNPVLRRTKKAPQEQAPPKPA